MLADDVLDLTDPAFVADPYPVFDRLRSTGSAVRHEGLGLYLAARHADADAVLRERRLGRIFTEREPAQAWETFNWLHADSILDSEPPKHTRLRSLVAKAFARGVPIAETPATWRDRTAGTSNFRIIESLPNYLRWYWYAFRAGWGFGEPRAPAEQQRRV